MTTRVHLAIACCLVAWISAEPGAPQTDEFMTYGLRQEITLHQPVVLDVTVRNVFDEPLIVELGIGDVANFDFELLPPGGRPVVRRPTTTAPAGERSSFESTGHVEIAPRGSVTRWILLSQFFDFDAVGNYSLAIRFVGSITSSGASQKNRPARTATLAVQVLPRNQVALERSCAVLLAASQDGDISTRLRAVSALAHTNDPVAVPYLMRAAESDVAPSVEIDGLVRIGGAEARSALETLARSTNAWTASYARAALARIKA